MRLTSFGLLLVVAACAAPADSTDTAADDQAIRAAMEGLNAAVTAQNDSLAANIYAEDAVLFPPGRPRIAGRANIRAFWAEDWPVNGQVTLTVTSVQVTGDWAFSEGTWTWAMPTPRGEQRDHGKFLDLWHRVDGTWQMTHDIWNSDVAPPTGA